MKIKKQVSKYGPSHNERSKTTARYYPPETMPHILCMLCLEVVLENSEKARDLYDEIMECQDLPGCQELLDKAEELIPKGEALLKNVVKESGFDYKKPPELKNLGIPYMRGLLEGWTGVAATYTDKITPWALKRKRINRDFKKLIRIINELIKVGFNKESDQKKGIYKMTTFTSNTLMNVIYTKSLAEYCRLTLTEWERVGVLKIRGKIYNMADIWNDNVTARLHREMMKNYKGAGFLLKHDDKLKKIAETWYKCRVMYSGPEEYCRKMLIDQGINLDPANISNEIKECDEAVGYTRRQ